MRTVENMGNYAVYVSIQQLGENFLQSRVRSLRERIRPKKGGQADARAGKTSKRSACGGSFCPCFPSWCFTEITTGGPGDGGPQGTPGADRISRGRSARRLSRPLRAAALAPVTPARKPANSEWSGPPHRGDFDSTAIGVPEEGAGASRRRGERTAESLGRKQEGKGGGVE